MNILGTCYGINATPDQMRDAITPKREMGEICMALKILEEYTADLHGKIWSIVERLEPVLTPETLNHVNTPPKMVRSMSPLAVRINSITSDLSRSNDLLEDLIKRLEL